MSNDDNKTNPEVTNPATREQTSWDAGWGVHHQTASAWDFGDNDGAGPESEEDDGDYLGKASPSDPANPDEESDVAGSEPVNPRDRRCWAPQPIPTETPRGGW